jgi:cyanophycin synthetase
LGQYGINTVAELAQVKFIVAKALYNKSILVVNADNDLVVEQARKLDNTLCWFSVNQHHALIQQQIQNGGRAVFIQAGMIVYHADGLFEDIAVVTDIPMTFNGSARHNIENALGVVGLSRALKLPFSAIRVGLKCFGSNAQDNPGRGNQYQVNGSTVIVDFAHNEHSMRAVVAMVKRMPANKRVVMFGHAGDRSDQDIRNLTDAVVALGAEHYIISELEVYLRGRELGDIPAIAQAALSEHGIAEHASFISSDPLSGAKHALSLAAPGDVILLFVLDQREQVHEWLTQQDS